MPIDVRKALAAPPRVVDLRWDEKDVMLYHLGVGAAAQGDVTDERVLRYVYERKLHVVPSFAVVAGGGVGRADFSQIPGLNLANVLQCGQRIAWERPVPASGRARMDARLAAAYDKGKDAILVFETRAGDDEGPLWTAQYEVYVKGGGGFGGERGAGTTLKTPDCPPPFICTVPTRTDQALVYRLSGDLNPLHADPAMARSAGFDRPVLHGLCTYGIALKAVIDTVLQGECARVTSYNARFSGVFFPGETLCVRIWDEGVGCVTMSATCAERDNAPVLSDASVTFSP
jgi:acyl dehydratase